MADTEPFADRFRQLAKEQDVSLNAVGHEAWDMNIRGTSDALLKKVLRGERAPNRKLIEAVAGALGVEPSEFVEWRLLVMRESLDDRKVGLAAAAENLLALETAATATRANAARQAGPGVGFQRLQALVRSRQVPPPESIPAVPDARRGNGR